MTKKNSPTTTVNAESTVATVETPKVKTVKNNLTGSNTISRSQKKTIREQLSKSIAREVNGITVGALSWSIDIALSMLRLMSGDGVQRPVGWDHVRTLATSMREAIVHSGSSVRWYDGLTMGVIASDDSGIDSRHRNIAYVIAFGSVEDIDSLLRILGNHPERPSNLDPIDYLSLDKIVKGWTVNGTIPKGDSKTLDLDPPAWCLPISIGQDREAFSVLDADQRKRTGADVLGMYGSSSAMLASTGIASTTLQECYRAMSLRTRLATNDKGETIRGTLSSGGNIHPDRYKVYQHMFGSAVQLANDIFDATIADGLTANEKNGKGYDLQRVNDIGYSYVMAVSALAIMGEVLDKDISSFVHELCNGAPEGSPAYWVGLYCEEKKVGTKTKRKCFKIASKDKGEHMFLAMKAQELFTALIACVLPETRKEKYSQSAFVKLCQETSLRLPGPDTDGCTELLRSAEIAVTGKVRQAGKTKRVRSKAKS